MDQMQLCNLFLHSLNRETKEEVQNFPFRSYEEILEGVLRINQDTIDSGCKIYSPNVKLVSPNQNNANYQNYGANNQVTKGVNYNHGATTHSDTDQAKNVDFPKNGNNKNNNNLGNQRVPNTVSFVNTVDVDHLSQKQNQTQFLNQYQNSSQGAMNHSYNNRFQSYNWGYNQQQQDVYQRPRDYDPNLYFGFNKVWGHDDRTYRNRNNFL